MTQPEPSSHQPEAERAPQDVVRHVIACSPCGESVDGLTAQDDVLRHLARPQKHPALVEHMLGQTARVGKHELEALLYEMGWASLKLLPEVSLHVDFLVQPRPLEAVSQQAKQISCRVSEGQVQQVLDSAPATTPTVEDAATLSLAFADTLLSLDCKRPRGLLLRGNALVELSAFEAAQVSFDEALSGATAPQISMLVRQSITRANLRAGRFDTALQSSKEFVNHHPDNPDLWLNYAAAAAWQGELDQFQVACQEFASSLSSLTSTRKEYWQALLATEVPWLALKTGLDATQVAKLLGADSVGPSHD